MSIQVRIPTILRPYTKNEKSVSASGSDLTQIIDSLNKDYPGIADRLLENNELRRFINIYINDEDVRFLGGLSAPVREGDHITILPAVAGGSSSSFQK